MEMEKKIAFNKHVSPICLAESGDVFEDGDMLTVAGWGDIDNYQSEPEVLQQVQVPYISRNRCNRLFYAGMVDKGTYCAGYTLGGRDSCTGDSGGPLMQQRKGVWFLVGVVSWGTKECAGKGQPGVYT